MIFRKRFKHYSNLFYNHCIILQNIFYSSSIVKTILLQYDFKFTSIIDDSFRKKQVRLFINSLKNQRVITFPKPWKIPDFPFAHLPRDFIKITNIRSNSWTRRLHFRKNTKLTKITINLILILIRLMLSSICHIYYLIGLLFKCLRIWSCNI